MADARPLVVVGGPIHPDALALLETGARARCFACCAARSPRCSWIPPYGRASAYAG